MAPRKRKATTAEGGEVTEAKKKIGVRRVTRSSTRLVSQGSVEESAAIVKEKVVKKAKVVEKEEVKDGVKVKEEAVVEENGAKAKTIVIEHCKQCNAFKTRAMLVKEAMEKGIDGIKVLVNPEKPRRGCFEIRMQGGETFLTLLDMKRPFPPLKALDMEKVISDIIEKVVNKSKVEKNEEEEEVKDEVKEEEEKEVKDEVKEKEQEEVKDEVKEKEEVGEGKNEAKGKTIVIEHCKQCNAFKTRALLVKEGLEKAIDGIQVLVNPEKPRRGCFEIREQGGETFVTFLDMKRPFPPLKALNMEKVISDIIEKVK